MRSPLPEGVHRRLNASTDVCLAAFTVVGRFGHSSALSTLRIFVPSGTAHEARPATLWQNQQESVNWYIVPYFDESYKEVEARERTQRISM